MGLTIEPGVSIGPGVDFVPMSVSIVGTPLLDISSLTNWAGANFYGSPATTGNYKVFTGSNYIETDAIDNNTLSNNDYTYEFWMRTTGTNDGCMLLKKDTGGYTVSSVEINNGTLVAGYWAEPQVYNQFGSITRDQWQHYTVTYTTAANLTAYINGQSLGAVTLSAELSPRDYNSAFLVFQLFNFSPTNFGSGAVLTCDFGEFRMYSRALTGSEVLQNFTATRGRWGV